MNSNISIEKLIQREIKDVPEDKLKEIYDLIHYFRIGIGKEETWNVKNVRFASEQKFSDVWKKEPEDVWESYL